jgi:hypothetical protein
MISIPSLSINIEAIEALALCSLLIFSFNVIAHWASSSLAALGVLSNAYACGQRPEVFPHDLTCMLMVATT